MYESHSVRNQKCKQDVVIEWGDDWTLPEFYLSFGPLWSKDESSE